MQVQTGLASLLHALPDRLRSSRVGLVTHTAAVGPDMTRNVDALIRAGVTLSALFSPEHGLYGIAADGAAVLNTVDARSGLPVHSLYGDHRTPTTDMLQDIDILVVDMQDVGVRFYTFVSTLAYVLQSAAQADIPLMVLDRPNPINGRVREGPLLAPGFESFVGAVPVPIRHGLTIGELAQMLNGEWQLGADLTVAKMRNWRRDMWFDDTGLPWVPTSPAMAHLSTAILYPGTCLLEGTNLSEGRGTPLPFEVCGAPWINEHELAAELNRLDLPGVRCRATRFVPSSPGRFVDQICHGVQFHVTDRDALRPVTMGLYMIAAVKALCPSDFTWQAQSWEGKHPHFDLLVGTDEIRKAIDAQADIDALVQDWEDDLTRFATSCRPYLLYT